MQAAGTSSIWHGTCYCAPCKRLLVFLPNSGSAFPFLLSFPLNWCKRPVRRKNQDNRKETGKKTSLSPSPPLWQTLNITAVILNLLFSGTVYDFRPNVEIFKWVYFVNIWSFATERDRTRSWQRFPLPLFLRETEQPSTCTIQQQLNTATEHSADIAYKFSPKQRRDDYEHMPMNKTQLATTDTQPTKGVTVTVVSTIIILIEQEE